MQKKLLFISLLISTFIYAEENNRTTLITEQTQIEKSIINETNATKISHDNNISNEENRTINEDNQTVKNLLSIKKDKPIKEFSKQQIKPIIKNFNMTKGDSQKGEEIFRKNFKMNCQTTAYAFISLHDQDEWEEIAEAGRFRETVFQFCEKIKKDYKNEWSPDLYQFAYEHACEN